MKHKKRNLIFIVAVAALALLMSVGFFAAADDEGLVEIEGSDFLVAGDEANYDFADGVLTVKGGNVTVRNKDVSQATTQRIAVTGDATLDLNGVNIAAAGGAAVRIATDVTATVRLSDDNTLAGAKNYAGLEVGYDSSDSYAHLTIEGNGSLTATGGDASAGIGSSYNTKTSAGKSISCYYGDITINSGTIIANGTSGGAGIGSANNNGLNLDGSSQSRSFKMVTDKTTYAEATWGTIAINGGTITATGNVGAGIGGGNHVDSGKIIISGGTIEKATSNEGPGIGSGRGSSNYGGDADKGHGYYFADITIEKDAYIKEAVGGWLAAGIGGAYECDAIINITGGRIDKAVGGNGNSGSYYQGAPGIGAGYQGNVSLHMSGGSVGYAKGGWSAPGIGYGAAIQPYGAKRKDFGEHVSAVDSIIDISGGTIELAEGGMYAAGIGSGNGCAICNIAISGGTIKAVGYSDPDNLTHGGAGIGSGVGKASGLKYCQDTAVTIDITGGDILAIGGWGASGIGSGANNIIAETINIDFDKADVEAYADGTKFAIDTRVLNEDGTTTSYTEGRAVTGNMLQGTFVHAYENGEMDQNPEGLKSIKVINDATGEEKELTKMPDGYRSYATNVSEPGVYTVYTDEESIGKGEGRFFSKQSTDVFNKAEADQPGNTVQYTVETGKLSDNFYLFPVKTVVVEKIVNGPEEGTEGLNETVYFALKIDTENVKEGEEDNFKQVNGTYFMKNGDAIWTESIDIVDGVPQGKAYFVNVDDRSYDIWEINGPDDTGSPQGGTFGSYELKSITTQHGGLIKATADGTTKGAFTVTKSDEGDKVKISAEVDFDKTEGQEWITVSLFADGKLSDESSKSLSKDGDHTATWTVDKEKDGEEIVYSVADTSNNAAISKDQWSDEVKIINTYTTFTPPVDIDIDLTKEIEAYYKASKDARATAVFRIIVVDEADKKLADRYVSFVFDKAGEQTKTVAFKKLEGPVRLSIEEVYSSGYKGVLKGGTASKAEYDLTEMDLSKPVKVEATFVNTHEGKNKYTDGVINNYKNKQFDHKEGE